MEIEKLGGTTERLYRLVAPLVMKPCILRENHIWFIAIEEERVVGFMPVEIKDKYAVINNYYIDKDDPDLLAALLREVIRHYAGQYKLQSVTHSRHLSVFAANGFSIIRPWKLYAKMEHRQQETL